MHYCDPLNAVLRRARGRIAKRCY